ncbi:unnamed protein product [Symbiodinium sp. CCMP2592]|nr:unnamed protein product [Symbiodinium sp. CCMP2592]
MQGWTSVPDFFTETLWKMLDEAPDIGWIPAVCELQGHMGLRHPLVAFLLRARPAEMEKQHNYFCTCKVLLLLTSMAAAGQVPATPMLFPMYTVAADVLLKMTRPLSAASVLPFFRDALSEAELRQFSESLERQIQRVPVLPRGGNFSRSISWRTFPSRGLQEIRDLVPDFDRKAADLSPIFSAAAALGARVGHLGSAAEGLGTEDSDIDVTILTEEFAVAGPAPFEESRDFQRRLLRKVRGLLVQVPGVEILEFISEAKRPLLRMILPCGKKADVSAENREGCQKSAFIARHLHIGHPMLARTCLCLKTWAQRRGVYGQQCGFPSGLGFSCMAIFAAQCFEPTVAGQVGEVPELIHMSHVNDLRQRDATTDEDLPRVVRGIFQFYADVFDWDTEQVSPRRGHRQARRALTADGVLSIEDPVLPDLDLARPYMNLERSRQLHRHFTATAELLTKGQWNAECLHDLGIPAGVRILDLYVLRENRNKRETRLLPMLTFIAGPMWKNLFGHSAELFKAETDDNSYYVNDKTLLVNRFISVPRDLGAVNCGA